tara:strand:+ start:4797 stop:5507 length:711 start_codon:yes stop_codon:yes gene_type:complete
MKKQLKNELPVSEFFYSIQGEGQTMGFPAYFLRLPGCNLLCQSKEWICDSIAVWRQSTKKAYEEIFTDEVIGRLVEGAHLIITGGEPMLQQKRIVHLLNWLEDHNCIEPIIEVETNGTIEPIPELIRKVHYWNCSPKLSNSGESEIKRINHKAIEKINLLDNSIFKFVISKESDFNEMIMEYGPMIDRYSIVLMPAGENQEQLNETRPMVLDLCKEHSLRFSDRLHIVAWNQKTGV